MAGKLLWRLLYYWTRELWIRLIYFSSQNCGFVLFAQSDISISFDLPTFFILICKVKSSFGEFMNIIKSFMKYCVLCVMQCFYCQIFGHTVCRRHMVLPPLRCCRSVVPSCSCCFQRGPSTGCVTLPSPPVCCLLSTCWSSSSQTFETFLASQVRNRMWGCDFLSLAVQHSQWSRF